MARTIYTVSQVNTYVKNMFAQDFMLQTIFIKGEVSNCKYHPSGHIYFTLKDEGGTISCVMFAGNRTRGLTFPMTEGMQVIVYGTVDVYERDGKYQVYAKQIVKDGTGSLYEKFEALKKELEEMGMFDAQFKRPIPKYVKTVGVVTASTGAAIRDIIQISKRRNPYVQIILYPAIVQGRDAAESIVNGIHALENMNVDVMIVGRGGGSMEDLWAFNERIVAQAVFDCEIPIISAVGHETDTTIIDFVSDMRAPTPSAAAELAVYDLTELSQSLLERKALLMQRMHWVIESKKQKVKQYRTGLQYMSPMGKIREQKNFLAHMEEDLHKQMKQVLMRYRHRMDLYIERLEGLSPLTKLKSGYSYVTNDDEHNIMSVSQVKKGEELKIRVTDGYILSTVLDVIKHQDED